MTRNRQRRLGLLAMALIVGGLLALKGLQKPGTPSAALAKVAKGPAVILFRGDNSASCRAIHRLVEQAADRYGNRIHVIQTDWTLDNLLIERYSVRFLPTVVFIDDRGAEVGRIVGESPAVQARLKQALEKAGDVLVN